MKQPPLQIHVTNDPMFAENCYTLYRRDEGPPERALAPGDRQDQTGQSQTSVAQREPQGDAGAG